MDKATKIEIEKKLAQRDKEKVCIALDWLSLYFLKNGNLIDNYEEGDEVVLSEDCYLLAINRPTLHFNTHFVIVYKKEECGHLLTDSKNEIMFKPEVIKVDFSNHTLYSGVWMDIVKLLIGAGLKYKSASRIDIAIDGCNYLQALMNIYVKQPPGKGKTFFLKNSSASRARFSAKVLNSKTMMFENFNVGSGGGNKMITIYNKTLELARSGKTYIQDYWIKNGLIAAPKDLNAMAARLEAAEKNGVDIYEFDGVQNIYRFELRLKSEAIKDIKFFTLEMLTTGAGLASIVKTHCAKYFEAAYNDHDNVTLCTGFDLLPYDRLEAIKLDKIERVEKDGEYKAKMTIHGIVQDVYKGYIKKEKYDEALAIVQNRVAKYKLDNWISRKINEWHTKYSKMTDADDFNGVLIFSTKILGIGSKKDVAGEMMRNNQPYNTANF